MRISAFLLGALLVSPIAAQAAGLGKLSILSAGGKASVFNVEMALTPDEQTRGLMNRQSLPADGGMIFDFGAERPISMWMKNTLIPLDMIFINRDGVILGIAERTVPMSLEVIASPGPSRAVLEVNGGTAERLGIKAGDKVEFPPFTH